MGKVLKLVKKKAKKIVDLFCGSGGSSTGAIQACDALLVKYSGTGGAMSVDEPLDTISTKDRYGLCVPQLGAVLDIRFRMLQPDELSAAMGFPKGYIFTGTREARVKQIGNAVACGIAKALVKSVFTLGEIND